MNATMGKSTQRPILAAGGIVVRQGVKPLVAIVQRRRDNAWVLPKGKLKANEKPLAAAKREAMEETGVEVRVHEFLGLISYIGGNGPKIAHFWRMQAVGNTVNEPLDDIKAVDWLPLATAIERLSLPHEQSFLRNVGKKAIRRTQKKPRRKSTSETPVRAAERVRMADDLQAAAGMALPITASDAHLFATGKHLKSEPRWEMLSRLTKHWQTAVGRTRRAG
jgi:8-oxo-dGTP pyrophosphatase MutT (NUDIX family)